MCSSRKSKYMKCRQEFCKSKQRSWLTLKDIQAELTYIYFVVIVVQSFSHVRLFATPRNSSKLGFPVLHCLLEFAQTPVCWVEDAIQLSFYVIPFSSCLQSFRGSRSFPMNRFFTSGGQIIGVSTSASVLPLNTQDWSPFGWTGWISLQSKGLSRVFSNTTV